MQTKSPHVLIIGGGICGPALGLFLQKAGISSSIYEAYPYVEGIGGGLNIGPNGTYVLQALGLTETVLKRGTPLKVFHMKNDKGKHLASMNMEFPGVELLPSVSMSRATLYEIFADELKSKNVSIYYEKRLTSITHTADKVIAHFADGTTAEGELLIGADGVNSVVRKHILPDGPEPSFVGIVGVGGFVPCDKLKNTTKENIESCNFIFGAKGFFGYGGADAGSMMWWTNIVTDKEFTREEIINPDWNTVKQELLETFKDYEPIIPEILNANTSVMRQNVKDLRSLPTWYKGRIMVIGDAAHAVSPNSGQGASMALEDAMLLAKLLRDNADYNEAFKKFEKGRKNRVEKIVEEGRKRASGKEVVSPWKAKIREWMITIFVGLFGSKGMKEVWEYKVDWEKSEK